MNRIIVFCAGVVLSAIAVTGCYSVKAVDRISDEALIGEGSIVFARAGQYTLWFGSHSPREYFEVVYERFSHNDAGLPVVEIGIRYRGGVSWTDWYRDVPQTVTLGAQCNFYATPAAQAGGPIIYSTNRERLVFQRGNVCAYKAVCPVRSAKGYQLVLGE
jgi:hypothetical protein